MEVEFLFKQIVDSAVEVMRTLGVGFLENVYSNSLALELQSRGIYCQRECGIKVYYKDQEAGYYRADLIVDNQIIIESKCVSELILAHELQLVNYLKATNLKHGMLINFRPNIEFKRKFRDFKK